MPPPTVYEVYEVVETRGDGHVSPVREVHCLYRKHDGAFLFLVDPMRAELMERDEPCMSIKRRGRFIGFACNRPKGHQGEHAVLDEGGLSVTHVWTETECDERTGDEPV
jgi:hypothetical protein